MVRTEDKIQITKSVQVDFEITLTFMKNYYVTREFRKDDFDNDDWLNMTEQELYDEYDLYVDFEDGAEDLARIDIDNNLEQEYGISYQSLLVDSSDTEIIDKNVTD